MADADDELDDLADDSGQDQARADTGDHQPGPPLRHVEMLHPPRHAEEAHRIERHEGDIEADQPEPERSLAPALMQAEAERLREPVGVAGESAEQHTAD